MRLQYILNQVFYQPALITPQGHASVRMFLESLMFSERAERKGAGVCGEEIELPQMVIKDGLAEIPVGGPIGTRLGLREKGKGAIDTLDLWEEIDKAESDPSVNNILFVFDSPGGMVSGTPELANRIKSIQKPKYAFAYNAHSAAYWLASATNRIYATQTSGLGSIGVYLPVVDESKWFEMQGVHVELIKSGKYKGAGFPGTTLTESQRENLQAHINDIGIQFRSAIRANRSKFEISDDTMQGQSFMGQKAVDVGLVDRIVTSLQQVRGWLTEQPK